MTVKQLSLALGTDPIAMFASYIGPSQLLLEESVRDFLCWGRVLAPIDVPERVLIESAAAIWTVDELAELRALQQARTTMRPPDDEAAGPDYDRAWIAVYKAEMLCCARLIRRVSPRWAAYWEGGWR